MIDTDFHRNVQRVHPFLGTLLVGMFGLFILILLRNALANFTQSIHTEAPQGVTGTLKLLTKEPIEYGSSVEFRSSARGVAGTAATYINTACFQKDRLVYQRSAQQGVSFLLRDQYERDLEWDGTAASCSATLLYRAPSDDVTVNVYVLDAVDFEVVTRE